MSDGRWKDESIIGGCAGENFKQNNGDVWGYDKEAGRGITAYITVANT